MGPTSVETVVSLEAGLALPWTEEGHNTREATVGPRPDGVVKEEAPVWAETVVDLGPGPKSPGEETDGVAHSTHLSPEEGGGGGLQCHKDGSSSTGSDPRYLSQNPSFPKLSVTDSDLFTQKPLIITVQTETARYT